MLCFNDFSPEERSSKILSFTPDYKAEILSTLPSLLRPSLASSAMSIFHYCYNKMIMFITLMYVTEQVGSGGNTSDVYSGGIRLESQLGH